MATRFFEPRSGGTVRTCMGSDPDVPAFAKLLIDTLRVRLPKLLMTKPAEPATFFNETDKQLDKAVSEDPARRRREFLEYVNDPTLEQDLPQAMGKRLATYEHDPRCKALLEILALAESKVPLGFTEDIAKHFQPSTMVGFVEVLEPLEEARKLSYEARARALKRALENAAEYLYRPFLTIIWALTCRAREDAPPPPSTLGKLIRELRQRLPQGSPLLDLDAGWLRNGAAHGNWKYHPEQDLVEVWDEHRSPVTFTVSALLARVEAWGVLSVKILWAVMMGYLGKNWAALRALVASELEA
jgi:hypothetical protein